jgi:nucleotide-binding universal stress UspA family protein
MLVPQSFSHLPTRVLIGTDFSPGSLAAARTALELFPEIEVAHVAHVAPRVDLQPEAYAAWISEYGTGVDSAFARFRSELGARPGISVDTTTLTGKPSRALLDFAKSTNVDAIVIGSQGHSLLDRILVGSTATSLVRGAQVVVIAVPGEGNESRRFAPLPDEAWARGLAEFTRRNAGRQALLEVDDPEIGAQSQQRGYPFQGAAWDHHDQRIEIMLGELSSTLHLTRGIGDVRAVDVLQDGSGRDLALRVAHGEGQTILTFVR